MRIQTERPGPAAQFVDLWLMQLSNWRWSWRAMMVTGIITPLMTVAALGAFAKGRGQESLVYVLTGSILLSLMFENQNKVAQNFAYMKAMGTLDFLGTLPVRRYMVILATVLAFFALSAPSLLTTLILGSLILGVHLSVSWLIVFVIPLCVLSLAGIGAVIGIVTRTQEEASSLTLLVTMILLFFGPVIIPASRLPGWLLAISHVSPTTYAASAIRQVLVGPVTGRIWLDLLVLVALTGFTLWFSGSRMQWKAN
ncbi:ABC transporter permease [Streptomyces sp. NPDC006660]|uniref:ABC transporter permease n=1 Tax=Streptomyces sp. NPDC006660 TaxID=3156901 RepID=UPI0033CCE3E0